MSRGALVVSLMLVCMAVTRTLPAQDFYEQRFQVAKSDLVAGRTVQAVDGLRIASFGFLDRPPLLIESLVRLALAQNSLGQTGPARETVERFMAVEQRFPAYASLTLETPIKSSFESLALQSVPRNVIAATPSLARLVRSAVDQVADLPIDRRAAAYEAGARKDSRNVQWPLAAARDAASRNAHDEVIRWTSRVSALQSSNVEAMSLAVHARAARGDCKEALAAISRISSTELDRRPEVLADEVVCLVKTGKAKDAAPIFARLPENLKSRADVQSVSGQFRESTKPAVVVNTKPPVAVNTPTTVPAPAPARDPRAAPAPAQPLLVQTRALVQQGKFGDAVTQLRSAVEVEPGNRAYRLALLEAAVLARNWRIAVIQLPELTPLASGEELYMFYASVALYETGRTPEARTFMERAKPRMTSSPLVDYYMKMVLGTS